MIFSLLLVGTSLRYSLVILWCFVAYSLVFLCLFSGVSLVFLCFLFGILTINWQAKGKGMAKQVLSKAKLLDKKCQIESHQIVEKI